MRTLPIHITTLSVWIHIFENFNPSLIIRVNDFNMYVDRKIVKIAEFLLIDYLSYLDLDKIYVDWFILFIQSKNYLDDYNMHL